MSRELKTVDSKSAVFDDASILVVRVGIPPAKWTDDVEIALPPCETVYIEDADARPSSIVAQLSAHISKMERKPDWVFFWLSWTCSTDAIFYIVNAVFSATDLFRDGVQRHAALVETRPLKEDESKTVVSLVPLWTSGHQQQQQQQQQQLAAEDRETKSLCIYDGARIDPVLRSEFLRKAKKAVKDKNKPFELVSIPLMREPDIPKLTSEILRKLSSKNDFGVVEEVVIIQRDTMLDESAVSAFAIACSYMQWTPRLVLYCP